MNIIRRAIGEKLARAPLLALLVYVAFATILLAPILQGAGQYWDWSFPYYQSQIKDFFFDRAYSWNSVSFGAPLGYSSDYVFRLLVSLVFFLQPEALLYLTYVGLFVASAFFAFRIALRRLTFGVALLIGFAAIANPAIFYKTMAGHFDYVCAYALMLFLVYFLLSKYRSTPGHTILVGLVLAFMGTQMQFFVFGSIVLVLYRMFYPSNIRTLHVFYIFSIVLLINFFWLFNFLITQSVSDVSAEAAAVAVANSTHLDILSIFNLHFSDATQIAKYFHPLSEVLFLLVFPLVLCSWIVSRHISTESYFFRTLFVIFAILSLAAPYLSSVPFVKIFQPLFREAGHFAPLILIFLLLSISEFDRIRKASWWRCITILYLCIFIFVNVLTFWMYAPRLDYAAVRGMYDSYRDYFAQNENGSYALAYPFFKPFGFTSANTIAYDGYPLNNSGSDNFVTYSNQRFVTNEASPHNFRHSIQYALYQVGDVNFLSLLGIRYFIDFSELYQSNYDKYVPKETYDYDLGLIKRNASFLSNLRSKNTDNMKLVGNGFYLLKETKPHIYSATTLLSMSGEAVRMLDLAYLYKNTSLRDAPAILTKDVPVRALLASRRVLTVTPDLHATLERRRDNFGRTYFVASTSPDVRFAIREGALLVDIDSKDLVSWSLLSADPYRITRGQNGVIDVSSILSGSNSYPLPEQPSYSFSFGIPVTSTNALLNGSFEDGLWTLDVHDCNAYDDDSALAMSLAISKSTHGSQSLALSALRHTACTYTQSGLLTGDGHYIFSFDYRSNQLGAAAGFFIQFDDPATTTVQKNISNGSLSWHNYTEIVSVPDGAQYASVYFYAYETDQLSTSTIHYDDAELTALTVPPEQYYLVESDTTNLLEPRAVEFSIINPMKRVVRIRGAMTPFFLVMNEKYHTAWQLLFDNAKIHGALRSWSPAVNPDKIANSDHIQLNGLINGWYVDIDHYCRVQNLCELNPDGSYDMDLVVEFWPQRWFYSGLLVSGATFVLLLCYAIFDFIRQLRSGENNTVRLSAAAADLTVPTSRSLPSRLIAVATVVLLITIAGLLLAGMQEMAQQIAVYAFILLCITATLQITQYRRESRRRRCQGFVKGDKA